MPRALNFVVWSMNGGPVPEDIVGKLEAAVLGVIKEADEEQGIRLLTQTVRDDADQEAA